MADEKKNYPLWKVFALIALWLGLLMVVPPLLILLWLGGSEKKMDNKVPEVQVLAEAYLDEQYPGHDFEIAEAYHSWYDNVFYVKVQSKSSADTHFTVSYKNSLEFSSDDYEWGVANRGNTAARIAEDYIAQAESVLNTLPGIDWVDAGFLCYSKATSVSWLRLTVGLDTTTLELDGVYDAAAMGWDHGTLELRFVEDPENLNLQRLLERLWEVDAAMTQAGVGYRLVKITLAAEPGWQCEEKYYIYDILREDLYSEDPGAILQKMWEEQEANRQALKEKWAQSDNN